MISAMSIAALRTPARPIAPKCSSPALLTRISIRPERIHRLRDHTVAHLVRSQVGLDGDGAAALFFHNTFGFGRIVISFS